ncbi:NAD(P)H-binding protein [Streptomyces lasiicapitis]|uniref:NmrA family transcriptional regulator n=1 Tax=Streptomyces lasiicapitis TaxID=1923961 RepID=A0ABQ2MA20_9ACTN|nr:NAD(P)H-binding protein [Streptomyces lasiicapitis]GGO48796.1 NmrA family transcriptional regulator [Streptomyces lasiicapitis]
MIVITAPTSAIGRLLVDDLLDRGEPLRLVARDPARLEPRVRERAEIVEGSHGDAAVIDRACAGADAVFWLAPADPAAPSGEAAFVDFTRPACEAFTRHGVKRVVGISALGRGTPMAERAGLVTASLAMDDLIGASGVPYRAVVCPSFMHNLLHQVDAIKGQGLFFTMADPDLKSPTVATRDIAATAARLLLDAGWGGSGEVACLGPEDLSPTAIAQIISEVLGIEVGFRQITGAALKQRMTGFGMTGTMAQGMVDMFDAKNQGLDNAAPRTAESTTPTTFRQWCEEVLKPAVTG